MNVNEEVTKSTPNASLLFGDWSQVALLEWGILEIGMDPFTAFKSGIVRSRAFWTADIVVLSPVAFTKIVSIT